MFGCVFSILGIKNEYFDDAYKLYKVRCVFQGSNVRTKTKTSTADLFEEPGSAPASVVAARTEIGVAALRGFNAFLRDADTAYLQAVIDTPTRSPSSLDYSGGGGRTVGAKMEPVAKFRSTTSLIADC